MPDTQAKITITAEDQASAVVRQVADSFSQIDQGGRQAAEGIGSFNLSTVASVAAGMGLVTTVQGAARALLDFGTSALDAGAQMQTLTNRASVLFGASFPQAM